MPVVGRNLGRVVASVALVCVVLRVLPIRSLLVTAVCLIGATSLLKIAFWMVALALIC